jgi:hypothetical protein
MARLRNPCDAMLLDAALRAFDNVLAVANVFPAPPSGPKRVVMGDPRTRRKQAKSTHIPLLKASCGTGGRSHDDRHKCSSWRTSRQPNGWQKRWLFASAGNFQHLLHAQKRVLPVPDLSVSTQRCALVSPSLLGLRLRNLTT